MLEDAQRIAREDDGSTFYVPQDTTYEQWARDQASRREDARTAAAQKLDQAIAAKTAQEIVKNILLSSTKSDTIKAEEKAGSNAVQVVGRIDLGIYGVVTPDITTDELIITNERIRHIEEGHPGDYQILAPHLQRMAAEPDFIVVSSRPNTAVVLKNIDGTFGKLVLRLHALEDPEGYKNSILTGMVIDEQTWKRLTKPKKVLYKRE